MSRAALLGPLLLLGIAPAAHAQARPLEAGSEVRLFVRGVISPFEGVLLSADSDELTLSTENVGVLTMSPAQVERSEVLGPQRNTLRGALIGGGVGLGLGVGLVIASRDDCNRSQDPIGFCDAVGDAVQTAALIYTPVLGAGLGALVGYFVTTGRWFPGFLPVARQGDAALGLGWTVPVGW